MFDLKFSDGNWMTREGFTVSNPAQAYDVLPDETGLTVYAPHSYVHNRACTLGGPMSTIRISSPMPDVIRVQVWHHKGAAMRGPEFELCMTDERPVDARDGELEATLTSGSLTAHLQKQGGFSLRFTSEGRAVTASSGNAMAYIQGPDGKTYMREQLDLGVGECIYGLGERFTPFVKNGQVIDIWNKDGGTGTEQAYKNIPFYVSSSGYGVFVNSPGEVSFEVGSERVSRVQFSLPGECLDYYIINGPSMKQVLERYTCLTGRPSLPPPWSFGLWLTTSFVTSYDEATVNSFVDGMASRDLPLHVFHFDCFWMKEFNWCDFEWDARVFPDPSGMLERLKAKGLKTCVWINPYISQRSPLFVEGMAGGYLLKKPNGDVWQWDMWQPGMAVVDFTNPEACSWYSGKLKALMDMGVDCLKTDFGERIPTDVVYHDGSDPELMHNYYAYLYNKVVFEALEEKRGRGDAVVFARSASVGSQKFPVHWGGDCSANYPSMAESLRGGLSLCLSGYAFWSHDIGGFEATATADVYKRWAAFGLLSTHSRLHGNHTYRVPWLFDDEAVDVLRYFTNLKCSLMPYLFGEACKSVRTGVPTMRAMVIDFAEDVACHTLDRQYMLGDSLLVAPIFNEEGRAQYYLPEGRWTNFLTGAVVEGGAWRSEQHGYMSVPLFVRPNSIVAVGSENGRPDYDHADGVTLHVFELGDGKAASAAVHKADGSCELEVSLSREGDAIAVAILRSSGKPWSLLMRGISHVEVVAGGSCEDGEDAQALAAGIRVVPQAGAVQMILRVGK